MFPIFSKGVFDIFKVSRRHHKHFFIAKINEFGVSSYNLELFFELIDIAVKLFLEFKVIRYGFVGVDIWWEFEEIDEYIVFSFIVAV